MNELINIKNILHNCNLFLRPELQIAELKFSLISKKYDTNFEAKFMLQFKLIISYYFSVIRFTAEIGNSLLVIVFSITITIKLL